MVKILMFGADDETRLLRLWHEQQAARSSFPD